MLSYTHMKCHAIVIFLASFETYYYSFNYIYDKCTVILINQSRFTLSLLSIKIQTELSYLYGNISF